MTKKTSNWSALPVGACSLCVSRSDTAFKDTRKGLLVGLRFGTSDWPFWEGLGNELKHFTEPIEIAMCLGWHAE